ncbi:zonular occludens toxin domain-containing protein [Photobacterium ganghwense]|uniref:zonular occludens toxin domain-containing protein n=1 Tax=Photobacterium ganghwense TaxID=320778 RepID=UPI001A9040F2|nr:zonular occludens toxin domain-containing protein [Photobacterium ganghwense]QSV17308.1 hypothetical protein FH974_20485 [Photobacterium ganghwense]
MADFAVVGFKGSGKGLQAVSKIQDAVNNGCRVATNLDIFPEHLVSNPENNIPITRLPDYPRFVDFQAIGYGCEKKEGEKIDESKFGVIVLDEISIWMNSRNWNDKTRLPSIAWLRQARKYRWHVYYLAQSVDSVDNQTRELFEHVVECQRSDRAFVPFIGRILNVFNDHWGRLPKVHSASVTYRGNGKIKVDKWVLQGVLLKSIFKSYDTEQIFLPDEMVKNDGSIVDMRATYSILPASYLNQWYKEEAPKNGEKPEKFKWSFNLKHMALLFFSLFLLWYFLHSSEPAPASVPEKTAKVVNRVPSVVVGSYISGTVKHVSKGVIRYEYAINGADHKPFYPLDYNFAVVPSSMCSATIKGQEFNYSLTCGGRFVPEAILPSEASPSEIFNITKLNPFETQEVTETSAM